jgi:serine/threonine protein kinase
MPLSVGKKLGTYEILALIGKGGMGEVCCARDIRLRRDVALKVLPEAVQRLSRFGAISLLVAVERGGLSADILLTFNYQIRRKSGESPPSRLLHAEQITARGACPPGARLRSE